MIMQDENQMGKRARGMNPVVKSLNQATRSHAVGWEESLDPAIWGGERSHETRAERFS
jgi:hypothetical protein